MPVTYATYSDFTLVYSFKGVSDSEINSYWLSHGALRVNEALGAYYTTPFSSNNETAKDLSIHFAALGLYKRTRNQTDSDELNDYIDQRLKDIVDNGASMITTSGDSLSFDKSRNNNNTITSNMMNYTSVFDMRCPIDQRVDPDLIDDTWDEDI